MGVVQVHDHRRRILRATTTEELIYILIKKFLTYCKLVVRMRTKNTELEADKHHYGWLLYIKLDKEIHNVMPNR